MDERFSSYIDFLVNQGFSPGAADIIVRVALVAGMLLLAFLANWIAKRVILRAVKAVTQVTPFKWDNILVETGVFTRLSHLAPALVIDALGPLALGRNPVVLAGIEDATSIYLIVISLLVLSALLNAVQRIIAGTERGAAVPVKGFTQATMLIATMIAVVFALSTIMGKSPLYFFSGIGALMAVFILVFKDALLGFVAGIQISVNQMVRVGDWIEMPKAGADGDVIDVSLTTVKVRNWDRTITTIPTYSLISDSFKNWRGMSESGGRRIKRSICIDMQSVRFADEAMLEHWKKFRLLTPYLNKKLKEIAEENTKRGDDFGVLGNGRRLTNIGTFRAYCVAYLRNHPKIHQDMTFLVRQLQPTENGLPLEIYVFTNDIRWPIYEGIQADIFDHMLAIIDQFGLRVFQSPSGRDFSLALATVNGGRRPTSASDGSPGGSERVDHA
jgi:miniconductance mechanosensitive channel